MMHACDAGMPPSHTTITVNGCATGIYQWGDAPRHVVLLHGITSNAMAWWRVAPTIAALGYRVTAVDMPGHGLSDLLPRHDIPSIAAHVRAACDAVAVPCDTIVGHSWGGATALTIAQQQPVRRLILIDPAVRGNPEWGQQVLPRFSEGVGQAMHVTLAGLTTKLASWHPCDIQWKALALQQCRQAAVDGFFLQSGSWNIASLVAQTPAKTLCLVADARATVIPSDSQDVMRHACTQWCQIPDTDHNMYRGGYAVTMPPIVAWLKGHTDDQHPRN
jgi:pimeloyl-ACP methyl ester carboxylesterase